MASGWRRSTRGPKSGCLRPSRRIWPNKRPAGEGPLPLKNKCQVNEFLQLLPFSSASTVLPSTLIFLENCEGKNSTFYLDYFAPTGTASSVAFTPLQGLEIVNPQAAEKKVDEANAKYFSTSASFIKVQTPIVPSMGPPRKINK